MHFQVSTAAICSCPHEEFRLEIAGKVALRIQRLQNSFLAIPSQVKNLPFSKTFSEFRLIISTFSAIRLLIIICLARA